MRILLVGGGGREHALAEKIRRDDPEGLLLAAPGNPGMDRLAERVAIDPADIDALADLAEERRVELTVVGPEAPLAAGIADRFTERELSLFGPVAGAAAIEASKAFAKAVMRERGVPTAEFELFEDAAQARDYVSTHPEPLVIKASGLAAGKGALVCRTRGEALDAVNALMVERRFGAAGSEVVVEEFMEGVELSTFFLCDGEQAVPLTSSRDYKRAGEGDVGSNTGGMGAYAPAGDPARGFRYELVDEVRRRIALPVLEALAERGTPYRGFLYAGLMLTAEGPKVVEFNCRLGDPEAQVVLPLTASDLLEPMAAVARGESLGGWTPEAAEGAALVTVLASEGYPGAYEVGRAVHIPTGLESDRLRVYHAGTDFRDGTLITAGGRVLGVVGLGPDLAAAARRSREGAEAIRFEGKTWRRDIGWHEGAAATNGPPRANRPTRTQEVG